MISKTNRLLSMVLLLSLLLCVCGGEAFAAAPTAGEDPAPAAETAKLRISELMASNKAAVPLDGDFPDWAELCNTGETEVELAGFTLRNGKKGMPLPPETLAPGEYLLVPCERMHLPQEGAKLELWDRNGVLIDSVRYENAPTDRSLVRMEDGGLAVCGWPSPGRENSAAGYDAFQETVAGGELQISEVMVCNGSYLPVDGETYDWVELKNTSDKPLELGQYCLTDKRSVWGLYPLPERTLQPGELVTLLCEAPEGGDYPVLPFGLKSTGDELFLVRADGSICDAACLHDIPYECSMGRMADRGGFFYFTQPTPGEDNGEGVRRVSSTPVSAEPCGIFENTERVTVTLSAPGRIFYTLDGSVPTEESEPYTEPLTLESTGVVRAVCFEEDALPSKPLDLSYFLNEGHTIPIASVMCDPELLFSNGGIYSRPTVNLEVPASVTLFAEERGFEPIACGLKIHGDTSREAQSKKSFKLCFRPRYDGELNCDLFENGVTQYASILLRHAQESSVSTHLRDILMHELAKECSGSLPTQDYRFCVLYLNGEYWGLYALREAHSVEHYARHYGYEPESVSMSQGSWIDDPEVEALWGDLISPGIKTPEVYERVKQRLDVENVITWAIIESYSGNLDINPPNVRFYRSTEDGVMRYALVDLDLGLFTVGDADHAMRSGGRYGPAIRQLMGNPEFRSLYLTRMSEYLHGPLSDENFLAMVERISDEIREEIPRDYARWGEEDRSWQQDIDTYLVGSTQYPGGHDGMLARSAKSVFRLTDDEWQELFADIVE